MNRMTQLLGLTTLSLLTAVGCSDDDLTAPTDDQAPFEVVLRSATGMSTAAAPLAFAPPPPNAAQIGLSLVEAITISIGDVEARRKEGGWVQAGTVGETLNLLDLPAQGITLVDATLPEGEYDKLRLFLTAEPTITLTEAVVVGRTTYEAGEHPLFIPSSKQNGLRLQAEFVVDADGEELTIVFDEAATVSRVTATGAGILKISPELQIRDEDGDDVGEFEDEDDDEGEDEVEGLVTSVSENGFTLDDQISVEVTDETEIAGDILSLEAVAEALANGEVVESEAEGTLSADGATLVADKVEFEIDDEDDEFEVEGPVTEVDADAGTFSVDDGGTTVVVLVGDDTEVDNDGDFPTFASMVTAFEAGTSILAEAEGEVGDDGVLVASEVEFETDD